MTLTKGQILTVLGLVLALVTGFLVRHDFVTTTSRDTANSLEGLKQQNVSMRLQMDRLNAYAVASYAWNVRVAQKMGWPDPPAPALFLPARSVTPPGWLLPNAMAEEPPVPVP